MAQLQSELLREAGLEPDMLYGQDADPPPHHQRCLIDRNIQDISTHPLRRNSPAAHVCMEAVTLNASLETIQYMFVQVYNGCGGRAACPKIKGCCL